MQLNQCSHARPQRNVGWTRRCAPRPCYRRYTQKGDSKLRIGIVFIALAFLSGCAAKNTFQMYEAVNNETYPAVSLIVNDGYVYSDTTCHQYSCFTYTDNSHLFALEELRGSGIFERVDINNAYAEYKIVMSFSRQNSDSEIVDFVKLMLMAGSLALIPIPHEYTYTSEFTVMHLDKVIGKYSYDRVSEEISFLFKEPQSNKQNAIKSIISNLMQDLKKDHVFNGSVQSSSTQESV